VVALEYRLKQISYARPPPLEKGATRIIFE